MPRSILAPLVLLAALSGGARAQAPPPGPTTATRSTPPTPRPKAVDDEPRVLTAEESAKRGRSPFLGEGGDGRYDGAEPWAELPPWKQSSFFGVRVKAQTVIYVVDCSESMADDHRLVRAKAELRRSVAAMRFPQRFHVIFYNDGPVSLPGDLLKSADQPSKDRLTTWLRLIEPDGGTDPRGALRTAIGLNPDAIYLLSDGLFPDGTAEDVASSNRRKVPIHCIDLTAGAAGDHLKRIARDSGGRYAPRD